MSSCPIETRLSLVEARLVRRRNTCVVVPEAKFENGVPQGAGWFVVNARESRWLHSELGAYCGFEGEGEAQFDQLGVNLNVLPPGVPMAMYHEEPGQEDFLVVRGECVLIVEGEERPLRQWTSSTVRRGRST